MPDDKAVFAWILDICKDLGVPWFTWVTKCFGGRFCCEFGGRKWHTGLFLRDNTHGLRFSFQNTPRNRTWLTEEIQRLMKRHEKGGKG